MLRAFRAAHGGMAVPTGEGKALEAWVLMKLAYTVRRHMTRFWRVSLRQGDGTVLPAGASFNFPSQRSRIQPSSPPSQGIIQLGTIEISTPSRPRSAACRTAFARPSRVSAVFDSRAEGLLHAA